MPGMEGVGPLFSHKQTQVSNGRHGLCMPDWENQMRQRSHSLEPNQFSPVYMYLDPPANQDLVQTIVQRKIPSTLAYCWSLGQKRCWHDIFLVPVHTRKDGDGRHMPLAWYRIVMSCSLSYRGLVLHHMLCSLVSQLHARRLYCAVL